MHFAYKPLDRVAMVRATHEQHSTIDTALRRVKAYQEDQDKGRRFEQGHCLSCHYFRSYRVGGAVGTRWHCGICGSEQWSGSTAVDKVCLPCAKEHKLCTQCGGDVEMRDRRRNWPEAKLTD